MCVVDDECDEVSAAEVGARERGDDVDSSDEEDEEEGGDS